MKYKTTIDPPKESIALIDRGLHEFNLAILGEEIISDYSRVLVTAKNEIGEVIGGIHGEMYWDWLHIDTLWVDEDSRGAGIGSELLRQIEHEAKSKSICGSHTETTDFQALDFYLKNGYEVFGELEGKPEGTTWYFIKKAFARDLEAA
jgi:ribosomal protein S18 acetylase RimI-like enzyme